MPSGTARRRAGPTRRETRLKFDERLVLAQWRLDLFEVERIGQLAEELKSPNLEGFDGEGVSHYHHVLKARLFQRKQLPSDLLLQYDQNIVRHWRVITEKRHQANNLYPKYFQYLSLLFTEIYLDRYFQNPDTLLNDLNAFVRRFNEDKTEGDKIQPYEPEQLNKLAFWSATGSGKTLLMHVNLLQYRHYLAQHGKERNLNRIILLTPNEGLSRQHLEEFGLSGLQAEMFSKDGRGLFAGKSVEIIDIHIFGIRADYMRQFKEYLEEEGLPSNEDRMEFVLPVLKNLGQTKLKTLKLKDGIDFKRDGPKPALDVPPEHLVRYPVVLDWYPRVQAHISRGAGTSQGAAEQHEGKLRDVQLAFMDFDRVFFELEHFKSEKAWHNLSLSREQVRSLLARSDWYTLYIPETELSLTRFGRVRAWEEVAIALLKKYCERYYYYRKAEYENPHLEYRELRPDDPNFIEEYRILIDESEKEIIAKLKELKQAVERGEWRDIEHDRFRGICFGQHLYRPLLYLKGDNIEVRPVSLNEGEREFVLDLRSFFDSNKGFFKEKELYLLRNQSRGRGIGFFEAGNFYPDFILWLLSGSRQHITFIDPKGIRNLEGKNDPKIRFHATIKELEGRIGDPAVILNSFILSSTRREEVTWWEGGTNKASFEKHHVLFQKEDKATYIEKLLTKSLILE
ncbi:MAG: DEAD/DEAH box helicase family protein [Planctomycetes bacterium]|nr:DEAD/DEAH box helicase family protein [Planctomycetota bacterium]